MRAYEFPDDVHLCISYEMLLDRLSIERTIYSTLDWVGDIGGLGSALASTFSLILLLYNWNIISYKIIQNTIDKKKLIEKFAEMHSR